MSRVKLSYFGFQKEDVAFPGEGTETFVATATAAVGFLLTLLSQVRLGESSSIYLVVLSVGDPHFAHFSLFAFERTHFLISTAHFDRCMLEYCWSDLAQSHWHHAADYIPRSSLAIGCGWEDGG